MTLGLFPVAEIFGPTIQGEGPQVGQLCYFIRFGGCDFRCSWCDSLHAVLPEKVMKLPRLSSLAIVEEMQKLPGFAKWVILSGGNPLLWLLGPLVDELHNRGYKVAVETQGSLWKDWLLEVDSLVISPKPPSAGESTEDFRPFMNRLDDGLDRASIALKVVIFDVGDLMFAQALHDFYKEIPMYLSVGTYAPKTPYTMSSIASGYEDEMGDILNRTSDLIETVRKLPDMADVAILPQLHVLLWGHKKGV